MTDPDPDPPFVDRGGVCPVAAHIRAVAAEYGTRPAVTGSELRFSYAELAAEIDRWARRLAELRLPPGSAIALQDAGTAALPAAFLGARIAGLVPVLLDPSAPGDIEAAVLATPAKVAVDPEQDTISPVATDSPPLPPEAGYLVFSSGSQGRPKGIVGSASGLAHFLDWEAERLRLGPGTRCAMLTSPSFDVIFRDMLLPLWLGGELLVPGRLVRTVPTAVLPWLADSRAEVVHVVPSLSARWIDASPQVSLPALQWTLFAGERLYDRHVRRWRDRCGGRIVNLYGPAETTLAAFAHDVPDPPTAGLQAVGRPRPGITVTLRSPADDTDPGTGATIVISSAWGSLGYLDSTCSADDLARLTRQDGVTTFVTRDCGRLDGDGDLVVLGRSDSLVKRHGSFVDTALIEAAALELSGVRMACCLQNPGALRRHGGPRHRERPRPSGGRRAPGARSPLGPGTRARRGVGAPRDAPAAQRQGRPPPTGGEPGIPRMGPSDRRDSPGREHGRSSAVGSPGTG